MVSEEYKKLKQSITTRLMQDMGELSFPRLIGSEGEIKAQKWLKEAIIKEGFQVKTEKVQTSLFRINFLQSAANLLGGILFLISSLLFSIHPLLFIIPIIVILVEIGLMSGGSPAASQAPNVPRPWKKHIKESENIYCELNLGNSKSDSDIPPMNIVFMGHYDSKSTRLTGSQRVLFYIIYLISAILILLLGFLGLIFSIFPPLASLVIPWKGILWVISIIGFLASAILAVNVVGNKSPGACDNATAVANILECMRYFKKHLETDVKNNFSGGVKFTFFFPTAEEIGLTGAFNFIKSRVDKPDWSRENTFCINWDLAGIKGLIYANTAIGIPKKECSKTMASLLPEIMQEQSLAIKQMYLPIGGWTDSLCFNYFKYESFTIGSGKATMKVHCANDTPDIVDPESLFNSWVIGVELAKKLIKLKKA
jgi:hypothetical protein